MTEGGGPRPEVTSPLEGSDAREADDAGSVFAVVVTHKRRALLTECLAALSAQLRAPDRILVVDNASTDGTVEMVRADHPEVELLALPHNVGGAGGFHEGLRVVHEQGATWAWLMDDDTIPTPGALRALLQGADRAPASAPPLLLSSTVLWTDGRLHPMNEVKSTTDRDAVVQSCERGLLPLRQATFVSLLVHRRAVDRFGLPLKHYFIWSDDLEYTGRILRRAAHGYLVPDSEVTHKTREPYTAVTDSGGRFYFHVRNLLYMLRGPSCTPLEKLAVLWTLTSTTRTYLGRNRYRRDSVFIVLRGLRDGVKPVPVPRT